MKKRIFNFAVCLLLCAAMICPVFASAAAEDTAAAITLPEELIVIGARAFEGALLDTVMIPQNTARIESRAFAGSSAQAIYLPESLEYIADDAFDGCAGLTLMVPAGSYAHRWAESRDINYAIICGSGVSAPRYSLSGLSFAADDASAHAQVDICTGSEACTLKIKIIDDETESEPTYITRALSPNLMDEHAQFPLSGLPKYFIIEAQLLDAEGKRLCSLQRLAVGNKPSKLSLSQQEYTIALGDSFVPEVTFDQGFENYVFSLEDPSLASIDGNSITATAVGSTRLTASARFTLSDSSTLNVVAAPTGIALSHDTLDIILNGGNTEVIDAAVLPHGIGSCFFTSSDPSVAEVNRTTGVITPVGMGSCVITAETYNGHSAECTVTVHGLLEGVKIGIDPGHQGKGDYSKEAIAPGSKTKKPKVSSGSGGKYTRIPEHVTNLEIGLKLRDRLVALGAEVYMTRETKDVNISNQERAKMMNELNADMVLRVHCNGSSNTKVNGMSIYVRKTGDGKEESAACAKLILNYMQAETGAKNLGVKYSDGYTGLNWSTVPSMLMELGYLSNKKEDVLLNTPEYQDQLITGMINGLCEYFGRDLPVSAEDEL